MQELVEALDAADVVLFSSPEYNGSVPGQLKNAIDWVSRQSLGAPLRGKPVAVIGGSPGQFGGVWGHGELRKVLGIVGARVADVELSVSKLDQRLADPDEQLLDRAAGCTRRRPRHHEAGSRGVVEHVKGGGFQRTERWLPDRTPRGACSTL